MLNQPSSVSRHSSHGHSSVMDYSPSGYVPETRPHSVLAEISRTFLDPNSHSATRSASCEKGGGTFVSNFCRTILDEPNATPTVKSGVGRNLESTIDKDGADVRQTSGKE